MISHQWRCIAFFFAMLLWADPSSADPGTLSNRLFRTVVLSTQPVTVGGQAEQLQYLNAPYLMADGRIAFVAWSQSMARGVYAEQPGGGFRLVVQEGMQAPGADAGANFSSIGRLAMSSQGEFAFSAFIEGSGVTGANNTGVWSEAGGSGLRMIARDGMQYAGSSFLRIESDSVAINDNGVTAFNETIDSGRSIWADTPGEGLGPLVKMTDYPQSFPASSKFSNIVYPNFTASDNIVFDGAGSGVSSSSDAAIWRLTTQGENKLIAREGTSAPGTTGNFRGFLLPVVNTNNQLAFTADLSNQSASPSFGTSRGIWKVDLTKRGWPSEHVATAGMQAPGEASGVTFSLLYSPQLNNNFLAAFYAQVVGPGIPFEKLGLWSETGPQGLHLVAAEGSPAPGFEPDSVFESFELLAMNSLNQVVFKGRATSADDSTGSGLWVEDSNGAIRLLLRSGDLMNVASGAEEDWRQVDYFAFQAQSIGLTDPAPIGLNDRGELAVHIAFTDGSEGLFLLNTLPIPEPGSLVLLAAAMGVLGLVRSRRGHAARVE